MCVRGDGANQGGVGSHRTTIHQILPPFLPAPQVLEGVRPFLMVAGGSIQVREISGVGGLQPRVLLHMEGNNQSLFSVRMEITQRILRNFMLPGLRVDWSDQEG